MTTIIVPFSGYLDSKIKTFLNLAKIAKKRRLVLSSQDVVGNNVIAVDRRKRKLLYLKIGSNLLSYLIIDLKKLKRCTIKKRYFSINAGELSKRNLHDFVKSIFLHLDFNHSPATIALPVFDAEKDKPVNIEQLEAKVKKWQFIVSELLPIQIAERA